MLQDTIRFHNTSMTTQQTISGHRAHRHSNLPSINKDNKPPYPWRGKQHHYVTSGAALAIKLLGQGVRMHAQAMEKDMHPEPSGGLQPERTALEDVYPSLNGLDVRGCECGVTMVSECPRWGVRRLANNGRS